MNKLIFLFTGMVLSLASHSQLTVITGADTAHAGYQVAVYAPLDYISGKQEQLASALISEGGFFRMEFTVNEPREVKLVVLHLEGTMYVEPGKTYQVAFPSVSTVDFQRFDRSEVELQFEGLPKDDLNNLIRKFNIEYNTFANEHYYDFAVEEFKGTPEFTKRMSARSKEQMYTNSTASDSLKQVTISDYDNLVAGFINDVQLKYSPYYDQSFFRDYVRYSLAAIELAAGLSKSTFYREYFMSQKMLLQNPAYMRVFHIFYHDLFDRQPKPIAAAIVKTINTQHDAAKLISLFENDSLLAGKDIRVAAVIKGLRDIYNNRAYAKSSIEKTLQKMHEVTTNESMIAIASNSVSQLKRNRQDWPMEDFTLVDAKDDKWSLSEAGGLPVYMFFFATWSPTSVKEMLLLEKLQENYSRDIRIVAICMDPDFDTFKKYLKEHSSQDFVFLYGYGDLGIREKCGVRSIPHAIMLDKDMRVMMDFTPLPSQGIEATFAKLKQQAAAAGQKPGTWNRR